MNEIKQYSKPDFNEDIFTNAPDAAQKSARADGIVPSDFHATSIFPEYIKIAGEWKLIEKSRMDCCVVVRGGKPYALEQRNVKKGDKVVLGRKDDASLGIYLHSTGFLSKDNKFDDFAVSYYYFYIATLLCVFFVNKPDS